ncbi:MAG: VPLPA-CTERM sorting domain-containing protein [Nitrosomonadaceae bacterium]
MKKIIFFICSILFFTSNLNAATLQFASGSSNNQWGHGFIGASNVEVLGELYDVSFVDGTFFNIFGDSSGIDALDYAHAEAFAVALGEQVFNQNLSSVHYWIDIYPSRTPGISSNVAEIMTPFALIGTELRTVALRNVETDFYDRADLLYIDVNMDTTNRLSYVFADWTKVSAVPLPATIWLFGSGLLGLIGMSRRKKSA